LKRFNEIPVIIQFALLDYERNWLIRGSADYNIDFDIE